MRVYAYKYRLPPYKGDTLRAILKSPSGRFLCALDFENRDDLAKASSTLYLGRYQGLGLIKDYYIAMLINGVREKVSKVGFKNEVMEFTWRG